MKIALILACLLMPVLAHGAGKSQGPWHVESSPFGSVVTNGSTISFTAKDAQAAQEMANELNKVAEKQEKKDTRDQKK